LCIVQKVTTYELVAAADTVCGSIRRHGTGPVIDAAEPGEDVFAFLGISTVGRYYNRSWRSPPIQQLTRIQTMTTELRSDAAAHKPDRLDRLPELIARIIGPNHPDITDTERAAHRRRQLHNERFMHIESREISSDEH
jgi:hypothetical protein